MGTDIYLNWHGKTKEDQEKQYTGYSIGSGDVGYLRASIGMVNENQALRVIFPDEMWQSHDEEGELYDFKGNYDKCGQVLLGYFMASVFNLPINVNKGTHSQIALGNKVVKMLKKVGLEETHVAKNDNQDFRYIIMWIHSVLEFFELGLKLQEKGKKPRVSISW